MNYRKMATEFADAITDHNLNRAGIIDYLEQVLPEVRERWGAGDLREYMEDQRFDDGTPFRVFYGEHPHSRSDNRFYAEIDGDNVVGFDGFRVRTKLIIEEGNYLKVSDLSGSEVRKQCMLYVHFNDRLVFGKFFREAHIAALWWSANHHKLLEHSVSLWEGAGDEFPSLIGRKVWWEQQPGIVTHYIADQGSVIIRYDGPEPGFKTFDYSSEIDAFMHKKTVKDDILAESIRWFRKE